MNYPSITIQGSIFLSDILEKIAVESEFKGQKAQDFDLPKKASVKDEINRAWASANALYSNFTYQQTKVKESETGTTQTRNSFILPFLSLIGYNLEISRAQTINEHSYAISHKDNRLKDFPVHIMGFRDDLDKKRVSGGPRMSPHALMQEYLNLSGHLYGMITNGNQLRLLRDSTRLINISYLEFDLQKIFEENLFADFALLFRLLHATRMPKDIDSSAESLIEDYHQDSLESGTRIRDSLSQAVESALKELASGFLSYPKNESLIALINSGTLDSDKFYRDLLNLIYRILFLLVIEERKLIFPEDTDKKIIDLYYDFYSVSALRKKADRNFLEEQAYHDLWLGLLNTFEIFDRTEKSHIMNIEPLGGDIFIATAIGKLHDSLISNSALLTSIRKLSFFFDKETKQKIRVNYGGLNVEEFGSVYEGLLEYSGDFNLSSNPIKFNLVKSSERASSGSHYTPDELVKPLIDNSLEHIIEDKLKEANPEEELLSITVCDVACGSGHILLNAARRIAYELAKVRSGEAQPTPSQARIATRDVISSCIYGVDLNPMAVKLCKIALWLEAHVPGQALHFLDNKIKCGNAIVGLAHAKDLDQGIADEAFKKLTGDDKDICKELRDRNKKEKKNYDPSQTTLFHKMDSIAQKFARLNSMPENNPSQIKEKESFYKEIIEKEDWLELKVLADVITAQFFIEKTKDNEKMFMTDSSYRTLYNGNNIFYQAVGKAQAVSQNKRFFHWFLEFPEIFAQNGFDVILGNPPFLGGQRITGNYGNDFANYIRTNYAPIGSVDLVTYFFRRIYTLIKPLGFQALISTNTIAQGAAREGGLAVINEKGGSINFAIRNRRWPGLAAVEVSLISIYKGQWKSNYILDKKPVQQITSYLDDSVFIGEPYQLEQNKDKSFQGSIVLGDGFVLTPEKAQELIKQNPANKKVIFPYLNGKDLNTSIDQSPNRYVINFFDWPLRRITQEEWDELSGKEQLEIQDKIKKDKNIVLAPPDYSDPVAKDFPECLEILKEKVKPERDKLNPEANSTNKKRNTFWWQYGADSKALYQTIASLERVMVVSQTGKLLMVDFINTNIVISMMCIVFTFYRYIQYSILSSLLHNEWAWKNGSTLESRLRYIPTSIFQTFPFPQSLSEEMEAKLEKIGEQYHLFRQELMQKLQLGLTKTYNQFHNPLVNNDLLAISLEVELDYHALTNKLFQKKYNKVLYELVHHLAKTEKACDLQTAISGIIELRKLHKEMDELVLTGYGWSDEAGDEKPIDLAHDFYDVDYLPENDRIRYTISPEARKEVLERLLLLNHKIHEEEEKAKLDMSLKETTVSYKKNKKSKKKKVEDEVEIEWE